jgi:gamma-glutamyltranspeptidase/glutathione hydrolase
MTIPRVVLALAVLLPAACRPIGPLPGGTPGTSELASFPATWSIPAGGRAVTSTQEMVASNAPLASAAGASILAAGGNAADAAVATGFALAVVYPEAGNLGGGGYSVIHLADGRTAAIDYREVAPRRATRDMFVDPATGRATDASVIGHRAVGVPGAVAGLLAAHERYGTLPRAQVLAPAIALARDGFPADSSLVASLRRDSALICRYAGCATWFPGGRTPRVGDTVRLDALARTLMHLSADGADGFYRGVVAAAIVAEMQRGGGLIRAEDLAAYAPAWRTPLRGQYRGHTLLAMPPSSSGGVTLVEALGILEAFGPAAPPASTTALHRMLGAFQLAFIDRNEYLADPDVHPVPTEQLTAPAYHRAQQARLDPARYIPTPQLAPGLSTAARTPEPTETTHYAVVDRWGNAVSTTTTINGLFGSKVFVEDVGIFLNNEMDDFTVLPGQPNMFGLVQGEANAVAPGKRMLSAMAPTIVLDPRGQVLLVVGSRGGPRIITGVAQVITNVVDYRMSLYDALAAPRMHFQGLPEVVSFEAGGFRDAVLDSLRTMGWHLERGGSGSPVAIKRTATGWEGTWDPRAAGGVAGR